MTRVTPETQSQIYAVKNGDTLSSIARRLTGSADYKVIHEQNKDVIGSNPNNLAVGMRLTIPGNASDRDDEW